MKKLIAIVLCLVLVLSFSVSAFATEVVIEDSQYYNITSLINAVRSSVDQLKSNVDSDFNSLFEMLLNITDYMNTTAFYSEKIYYDYFGIIQDIMQINDKMDSIIDVLADPEDQALKESQQDNQQYIQDNFFTPGSAHSLDTNKLGALTSFADSFSNTFDFSSFGSGSPLDQMGEGSAFMSWFTEATGQSMDPDFVASEGGGGGGSDPDPDPDPDPEPETTATPTLSYNESTFTVTATGNGTVLMYVDGAAVSNPYTFTQGEASVTYVVTATAQEDGKLISNTARLEVTVPAVEVPDEPEPEPETTTTPSISYNEPTFTVTATGNGTVLMYVDGMAVSNPYTFTQGDTAVTYVVTATAQEDGKLISNTARLEVTVPKYEPPFTITNLIPTSTSSYSGSSIYNGVGYRNGYVWNYNGSSVSTSVSGLGSTGWMNTIKGDVFYIYNAEPYRVSGNTFAVLYNGSSIFTESYSSAVSQPDSNGVVSWTNTRTGYTRIAFNLMNLSASSIVTKNEYPLNVASTFSLRGGGAQLGNQVVTNFYNDRQSVFEFLLRGGWR